MITLISPGLIKIAVQRALVQANPAQINITSRKASTKDCLMAAITAASPRRPSLRGGGVAQLAGLGHHRLADRL